MSIQIIKYHLERNPGKGATEAVKQVEPELDPNTAGLEAAVVLGPIHEYSRA